MDEIKKQISKLEDELNLTIVARERARADGDENHENIYKSEQAKLVEQIQDLRNQAKQLEEEKIEMPTLEEEVKKGDINPPVKPFFEGEAEQSKIQKLKDEYDSLNDLYMDALDELEEKRVKMENGEIPYEEYQKFSLYVIDRYKFMKNLYEQITKEEDHEPSKEETSNEQPSKEEQSEEEPSKEEPAKEEPSKDEPSEDITNKNIPIYNITIKEGLNIVYDAKNNSYNYEGQKNGKPLFGTVNATQSFFKKSKNKKNLINLLGEANFASLFSGPTAKAYKKCDPHVVQILVSQLGINECRDYLLELSQGKKAKKEKLPYTMTYDLSEIKTDKKLGLFDRIRITRMANKNKQVAQINPKLSRKQLAVKQNKLLAPSSQQYDAGELNKSDERMEFVGSLRDFEPVEKNTEKTTEPNVEKNKDKGAR